MLITAFNPPLDELEITWLSIAAPAGTTTLSVKNNDEFQLNDRILVGDQGQENAEIVSINGSVSEGQNLAISALVFNHNADEPVVRLRYDEVKFYRSTNGANGTYLLLATESLDVDGANSQTVYDDTTGLAAYYYEVSYYNSVTALESTLSDPIPGSGYARNQVGFLIDEILREVSDMNNLTVDPTELLGWFNEVNDDLQTRTKIPYKFLYTRTALGMTGGSEIVPFPTDSNGNQIMWKFDRMDFNFVFPLGSQPNPDPDDEPNLDIPTDQIYPVRVVDPAYFRLLTEDQNTAQNDQILWMMLDLALKYFRFYPTPVDTMPASLYLYYYAYFAQLETYGQTFQTPTYQPYKKFSLYRYFMKQAENNEDYLQIAAIYKSEYEREVANLNKANKKDVGSPKGFKFGSSKITSYDENVQPYAGNRKF